MAKLSAYGRETLLTFIKVESTPTLKTRTSKMRLMSDGTVLNKFDGVFTDGMKLTGAWKKRGVVKDWLMTRGNLAELATKTQAFVDYATKLGYTRDE